MCIRNVVFTNVVITSVQCNPTMQNCSVGPPGCEHEASVYNLPHTYQISPEFEYENVILNFISNVFD